MRLGRQLNSQQAFPLPEYRVRPLHPSMLQSISSVLGIHQCSESISASRGVVGDVTFNHTANMVHAQAATGMLCFGDEAIISTGGELKRGIPSYPLL